MAVSSTSVLKLTRILRIPSSLFFKTQYLNNLQACLLSAEKKIKSATTSSSSAVSDVKTNGSILGPEVRESYDWGAGCVTNVDVDNIDFDLIHRSNSLTSSHGASSPTSIMGKNHEICRSSPTAEITLSTSKLRTVSERNVLKLVDTNLDGAVSNSSVMTVSPRRRQTVITDDDCIRLKRKIGSDGGSDDSNVASLIPTACAPPTSAITNQTAVSDKDSAQVSRSSSPPKFQPQASSTEGEIIGWDRSIEELECGQKDEYISSRRRRRLNLIVPNPRKPRTADYMCSMCNEMYQVVVGDNPWWAVYLQQCPLCKQQQVPRIDINSASNAIELDPNVMALYGEGVEDSGDDECEGGSEDEEDAEKDEDDEAVAAAAAEADQDDLRSDVHPFDGEGLLAAEEASKLLVLMCHARSCTGIHASPKHAEICKVWQSTVSDIPASHRDLTHSPTHTPIFDFLAEHEVSDATHQRLQRHRRAWQGLSVPLVPAVQEDVKAFDPLL